MQPASGAASSPLTWILAGVFFLAIQAGFLSILWEPLPVEPTDLRRVHLIQTHDAVRRLLVPETRATRPVVILGDSRVWLPARESTVQREVEHLAPERDLRVENLAVFGARIGDLEAISRELGRIDPALVILALGGIEMLPLPSGELGSVPVRILDVGWRDDPLRPQGLVGRLDRWLRTLWPFYRFRLFAAAQVDARLVHDPVARTYPERFASTRDFHDFMHGTGGTAIERAYRRWRRDLHLQSFVAYMRSKGGPVRARPDALAPADALDRGGALGLALLDRALGNLAEQGIVARILLMPENPILAEDVDGRYHRPGFSDRAAARIGAIAAGRDVEVVDGRRWMPATAFLDFVHLIPDVSGFHTYLAKEIVRAIRNP